MKKEIRDMTLYEAFDGKEIFQIFEILGEKITKLKDKMRGCEDSDIERALGERIEQFSCLYDDMIKIWNSMLNNDHHHGIRNERKL